MAASNITNEIIITAMDRFVWFVLLVVMSHLVTEFTRVTGYARGSRHDVVLVNDSLIQPKSVANMIFYPGEDYGLYDHQMSQYNNIYPNNNYNHNNNNNNNNPNPAVITGPTNAETIVNGFPFSFRPLIDSIFEIPISTLRAVNNLVARLTGSYQHQVTSMTTGVHKSTNNNANPEKLQALRSSLPNGAIEEASSARASISLRSATANENNASSSSNNSYNNNNSSNKNSKGKNPEIRMRSSLLREVNA